MRENETDTGRRPVFKLVDSPTQMPGVSILGDTRGPMVDLGVDVNGWVYLSMVEAEEVARTIGWVAPHDHDNTAALHEAAEKRASWLEAQLEALDVERPKVVALDDVQALLRDQAGTAQAYVRAVAAEARTLEPVARKKPGPKPKQAA